MRDPYEVLGISPNATDDEIKKAYRSLSRKYHPDANINNPNKAQAEERFKEVQQAYDQIIHGKQQGYGNGGFGYGYGSNSGSSNQSYGYGKQQSAGGSVRMQAVRNYIASRHYQEALNVLAGMGQAERTALWYYYSAVANSGVGNNLAAVENARMAVQMEPSNMEFRQFLNYLENGGNWYQSRGGAYEDPYGGAGRWCLELCLMNLFCRLCCCGPTF